jgi:uncharacterized membrane protein YkvI
MRFAAEFFAWDAIIIAVTFFVTKALFEMKIGFRAGAHAPAGFARLTGKTLCQFYDWHIVILAIYVTSVAIANY